MSFDFKLPDLGEGIREAEILGVKVAEGQTVAEDQVIFEVETDKAVVEIPSPAAGTIIKINVKAGQIVPVGTVMISIEENASSKSKILKEKVPAKATGSASKPSLETMTKSSDSTDAIQVVATPATRQLARELKIDLHLVPGSGPAGRIFKEDVLTYVENKKGTKASNQTAAQTSIQTPSTEYGALQQRIIELPDFTGFGEVERVPMRSVRRSTAQLMSLSWAKIPHVMHSDEADITELEKFRKKYGEVVKKQGAKLTLTAFIIKAATLALKEYPDFNTSLDEQANEIIFKHYYNIGMAVATKRGLVVPVIQAVDKKTILELALEISEMAEKARNGKTELADFHGATFTVTNIGSIGGTSATPIIHYPEAAILAVMKTTEKPIFKDGKIVSGLMTPLCLGFDHRITDGAQAARFLHFIIQMLEEPASFEKYLGV